MRVLLLMMLFVQDLTVTVKGRVTDVTTGEPLAKAVVSVRDQKLESITGADGRFEIKGVRPGEVELYVTTVGYGLLRTMLQITTGRDTELEVELGQEVMKKTDEITVTTSVFEPIEASAAFELTLNNTELRNLAGVMIDDPLRSVQTLPGVAATDDFSPDFSVRGFGLKHIGLYIDGALLNSPFHTVRDIDDGGALTILNGDLIEGISLITGAAPPKFGDRIGANLSLQTRDTGKDRISTRGTLSMSGASITSEGPIGKSRKASWLVSARKSYLDYIISRIEEDPDFVFNFQDIQSKLSYDVSDRHLLRLLLIHGNSGLNRDRILNQLGQNSLLHGDSSTSLVNFGWTWLPSTSALVQTSVYWTRENAANTNRNAETLFESDLSNLGLRTDIRYRLIGSNNLEAGIFSRRLDQSASRRRFDPTANQFRTRSEFSGDGWYHSGYFEDSFTAFNRLTVSAGARVESFDVTRESAVLPRASVRLGVAGSTQITAAYGQYAQYPDFDQLKGEFRNPDLRAERSTQYSVAIEQALTGRIRLRVEGYDHSLRGGIFSPETEWRIVNNQIVGPRPGDVLRNALRGYSRGFEVFLQRRSANKLSGWIAYGYARARWRDPQTSLAFDGDFDQRHTFNAYGSYRLTQTWNLSAKYRYGSAFPIPGFYQEAEDGTFFLTDTRNRARQPVYSRLDVRVNKAFLFDHLKLTLFAEAVNLLNREHRKYTGLDGIQSSTRRVFLDYNDLFPIIPTFGMSVEF